MDSRPARHPSWYVDSMEHLVEVVQDLSHAKSLNEIMSIVRLAARELTGADGATFVLRDEDRCFYAEENAIAPLWKGQRFPMSACISGWVMMHGQSLFIEDIYQDERIPKDAYRPTFIKSLLMVPIRKESPIGAIGNYWARNRVPAPEEITILENLANLTSVAMENVDLYEQLHKKIEALQESNEELNRFAWIASHDLKSPLRSIDNLSAWIEEDAGPALSQESRQHILTLRQRVRRMERLMDDILSYAQLDRKMDSRQNDWLSGRQLIENALDLMDIPPGFRVEIIAQSLPRELPRMPLKLIFTNLIGNAIKHNPNPAGHVWIDCEEADDHYLFSIRDDGPGIAKEYHAKIFEMFQKLGSKNDEGNGMGLAFVRRLLAIHGGTVSVESSGPGSTFKFTWPKTMKGS